LIGNAELRLAEIIEPNHPEVILFNERIHIESENLFISSLEAITARSYQEAIKLINHCINLSCEDIKLYITKAKILRLCGDLDEGIVVIQQAADMYINASISEDCTNLESFSTDNSEYNIRRQFIKLPEDMKLQKNLLINDMAIRCAAKGDYLRSIALLNTAMNHANFKQEMLFRSALSSTIHITDISKLSDRMEQVRIFLNLSDIAYNSLFIILYPSYYFR
jgi:tetratricopeptide (TPR) repeat protein